MTHSTRLAAELSMMLIFSFIFMVTDSLSFSGEPDPDGYFTGEGNLKVMQAKDHKTDKTAEGYPNHTHGIDMMRYNHRLPAHMQEPCKEINRRLNAWFGSKFCVVMMYYPPGGFMGWHNNSNCPGYNTLISYSHTGDSSFTLQDPQTKKIVEMKDPIGWSVKIGYFGDHNEPENQWWHCANSNTHRITFGYVIPDQNMWEMMCADILDA